MADILTQTENLPSTSAEPIKKEGKVNQGRMVGLLMLAVMVAVGSVPRYICYQESDLSVRIFDQKLPLREDLRVLVEAYLGSVNSFSLLFIQE